MSSTSSDDASNCSTMPVQDNMQFLSYINTLDQNPACVQSSLTQTSLAGYIYPENTSQSASPHLKSGKTASSFYGYRNSVACSPESSQFQDDQLRDHHHSSPNSSHLDTFSEFSSVPMNQADSQSSAHTYPDPNQLYQTHDKYHHIPNTYLSHLTFTHQQGQLYSKVSQAPYSTEPVPSCNTTDSIPYIDRFANPATTQNQNQIPLQIQDSTIHRNISFQNNLQVASPPLPAHLSSQFEYHSSNNQALELGEIQEEPSSRMIHLEGSSTPSATSPFTTNISRCTNTDISPNSVPRIDDVSSIKPIPGCMAYYHPLIPVIPSASGNRKNTRIQPVPNELNVKEQNPGEKRVAQKTAFGSPIWSAKDDQLLRYLKEVEKIGWRDISMYFPTRTINACQFRWRRLVMKDENKRKREEHKAQIRERLKYLDSDAQTV